IAVAEVRRRLAEEERAIEELRVRMEQADAEERERLQRMHDYRVQLAEETRKQLELTEKQILADVERIEREKALTRAREREKRLKAEQAMRERLARESEKEQREALQAGADLANSFIRGMKSVMEGEDFRSILS